MKTKSFLAGMIGLLMVVSAVAFAQPSPRGPDWDKIDTKPRIFNMPFSISTSETTVEPNEEVTFNISMSVSEPDTDCSDGSCQYQWGSWAFVDENGTRRDEEEFEEIEGTYTKSVTVTTPEETGEFALVGSIYQKTYNYNYDTGEWEVESEGVLTKESQKIDVELPGISPTKPTLEELWDSISDFLSDLFTAFK